MDVPEREKTMSKARQIRHWRTASDVACFDITSGADRGTRHSHITFSIGLVIEGASLVDTGNSRILIPQGSLMVGNPFRTHASSWIGAINRHFIMHIPVSYWQQHAQAPDDPGHILFLKSSRVDDANIASAIVRLMALLEGGDCVAAEKEIRFCVSQCARTHCEKRVSSDGLGGSLREDFVERVVASNSDQRCTVNEVARDIGISRFKLSRELHQQCGMQPRQLKKQVMVSQAGTLILRGNTLSAAAVQSGFSDQSHMNREFKKIYGITPREFQGAIIV